MLGPDHAETLNSRTHLAMTHEALVRWTDVDRLYRDALDRRRKAVPPDTPVLAATLAALAGNLL